MGERRATEGAGTGCDRASSARFASCKTSMYDRAIAYRGELNLDSDGAIPMHWTGRKMKGAVRNARFPVMS